jgi:trypsin
MSHSRIATIASILAALLIAAAPAQAQKARTSIVGGTPVSVTAVPWQVYIHAGNKTCGGSIVGARTVLTAAHCIADGTTKKPANTVTVLAGTSETWVPGEPLPGGSQRVQAASLRIHPYYVPEDNPTAPTNYIADDVGVITLASNLSFNARVRPIGLVGPNAAPAAGTPLQASGFGKQAWSQPQPDGRLYVGKLTAMSDAHCLEHISPNQSPSVLCANGPTSATCSGDSGGPVVGGGVLVGVVSATSGRNPCDPALPGLYADLAAPEIRAFVDGSNTPPRAPRYVSGAGITALRPLVVGSPLTCTAGAWQGAASLSYAFVNATTRQTLQAGASASFAPTSAHLNMPVWCVTFAANAGGVSAVRSATEAPILADTVPPQAVLRRISCRKRRCKVRFQAADRNSLGALTAGVKAVKKKRGWCRKKRGKGRKRCTKRRTKQFAVKHKGGVEWVAKARRVPRGRRVTFRLRVRDAAGNPARGPYLKKRVRVR